MEIVNNTPADKFEAKALEAFEDILLSLHVDGPIIETDITPIIRKASRDLDAVDMFYYLVIKGYAIRRFSKQAWTVFLAQKGLDYLAAKGKAVAGEPVWIKERGAGRGRKPLVPVMG